MKQWSSIPLVVTLVTLYGCSNLPESFAPEVSDSPVPSTWSGKAAPSSELAEQTNLLSLIAAPEMEEWVKLSLQQNPNLRQLALQLQQAGWTSKQQKGARLPTLDLITDANRQRQLEPSRSTTTSYNLQLSTRWEVDIWGRLADLQYAAEFDEAALAADYLYAQRSLSANIIKTWLSWMNAQKILDVETKRLETLSLNEQVIRQRYQGGLGKLQDLETARTDTEQTKATYQAQLETVASLQRQFQELSGSFTPVTEIPHHWPDISFPDVQVPGEVMAQRPDLIAAFQRIQAADKRSAIAYKNLLPSFTLTLDASWNNSSSRDLLRGDPTWQLLGQLTQPLFRGGQLRADLKISELQAEQAYWAYQEKLLAAVIEIENALGQEQSLGLQQQALNRALSHAQTSQKNFEKRYLQGLVNIIDVLNAQRTTFTIQVRLLQVELARVTNRIDLGLALGLSIQSDTPAIPEKPLSEKQEA